MKFYFAGSIRGESPNTDWFHLLIKHISKYGKVLTEHSFGFPYEEEIKLDDFSIYETDIEWLRESDALIAEVTAPSLGVGYEIAKAEEWGKPILLLYKDRPGRKPSAMLNGNKSLKMVKYSDDQEALRAIDIFMKQFQSEFE